ncbi:MAG: hypothetical protein HYV38_02915 [Candidatus Levybacteria bacterium]|nr:hypothetical protein [Candidatus Levybacteria bacterium]MBI2421009.1 hypothetical protein [Candidatus Levybacteria bacterium]
MKESQKKIEESWDRKKVFLALSLVIILLIFGFFGSNRYFGQPKTEVKGDAIKEEVKKTIEKPNINIKRDLESKVNAIREDVDSLDVKEVASSSPQIQKVLNDIKSIQNLPSNEAREACMKICSGI